MSRISHLPSVPSEESYRSSNDVLAHNSELQTAPHYFRGGLSPRTRRRVQDYIMVHLNQRITNDALAQVAGLSVCYFARAFKETEGMSPHRYVLNCRVKRAMELLLHTQMPLSEIAMAMGFSDQSHYTRCFREICGLTPGSYRWLTR
jgi:AraC-like DNA-binding protein